MAFSKLSGKGIDLSSNVLTSFASTGIDDNATSTAITIDTNGDLGIGDTNPDAKLSVATDQQLIARLASTNTSITGIRLEGVDASASNDNVYVDWFYDAENRQYGFGEGTASGSLPITTGISQADIVINNGNVRIPSEVGLSSLSVTTNPLTLGSLTTFNLAFDSNEIQARNNGAAESLVINKAGGNVGIGWNNPQVQLDLYQVTGDDLRISASSSDYWGINAGSHFNINDSGTIRFKIYDTGKILIGDDASPETLLHIRDSNTTAYSISETGLNSYTPQGGDLLQVQNYAAGTDDIYAGIWFETGNPATNTTGTNRSGRFALVPQNDQAYGSNFVWQLRTTDAALNEYMRLSYKGHLRVPAKVHFGMPIANIADDTNPGARLKVDHNQGTPDEAPVAWIERQNNLATPTKAEAALRINDHQSNYPLAIRDHNDNNIFSILGDGRVEIIPVDTDLTSGRNYLFMDVNVNTSEAQWTGADYKKTGIFVDMDASGTGGNTADELRLYGIRADCRSTHQTADLVCGLYGYAETQHSTGTTSNTYGVYGYGVGDDTGTGRSSSVFGGHFISYAYATGTGGSNTHYALYGKTLLTTSADKDHASVYGSRFEIEIDNPGQAQTVTNAYVVAAEFDNDSAGNVSISNSYLYYGNYAGGLPTNAYGLYILDSVDNYLAGDLDVGGTKNFQIKHPLPSLANTHNLVHTVIEGPSADNMYNGMVSLVDGSATINIDTEFGMTEGTFVALNRNIRRSVTNEEGFTAVKCSLNGNILTITAQDNTCTDEVFWIVIGQRQDEEIKASTKTDAEGHLILEPERIEHERPEKVVVEDTRDID